MASTINADNGVVSGSSGVKTTADTSGVLALQSNGSTGVTLNTDLSVTFAGSQTYSAGTANGVTYLNGSKVLTSGSALTFDGTNFATTGTITSGGSYNFNTTSGRDILWGTSSYTYITGNPSTGVMAFGIASSELMRLTSTGLGIGTSSPFGKLAVSNGGASGFEFFTNYIGGGLGTYIQSYNRSTSAYMDTAYNAATHAFYTSGSERARISSAGGFSVGTTADPGAGAIYATGNITAYYSDDRLKTRLGNIENALDKVDQLQGFYYEANETAQALGYKVKREVGVSAQSVQAVLPEIVSPAPIDQQYLTVDYERLVPLLIEAVKELRAEVKALKGA